MSPMAPSWRAVRVALEKLRKCAIEVHGMFETVEAAGVPADALLEAVRIEFDPWDRKLEQMRIVSDLLTAMGSRTRIDLVMMCEDPIATDAEMERYEVDQGYLAYYTGKLLRDCPYKPGDPANGSWRQGWLEAKDADNGRND